MKQYLFFDLDGTVTDSKTGIIRSVQHALKYFGVARADDDLLYFIGPPLRDSFGKLFGGDTAKAELAVQKYREYYSVTGIFENALYDGVADMLGSSRASSPPAQPASTSPEPPTASCGTS